MLDMSGVVVTLATVISGLTSYMAWFFRYSLKAAEAREARAEARFDRYETMFAELAKTVGQDATATTTMATQVTRVFDYVTEEQMKARLLGQAQRLDRIALPPADPQS